MPPQAEPRQASVRADRLAAAAILAALGLHLAVVLGGGLDLAPDEALYWDWSRHLAMGYTEKPPMVAWLIGLTSSFLGDTEAGARLAAPFLSAACSACLWLLARRMFGATEALLSLLLFLA